MVSEYRTYRSIAQMKALLDDLVETQGKMHGEWDSKRMHQALSNLVFNALKYILADKPIRVGLDGPKLDEIGLTVCNEGKPISSDLLPNIFEPLVRGEYELDGNEQPSAGANVGLGLHVVRQTALAHGGTVTVTSGVPTTCFELRLPRVSRPRDAR